MTLLQPLLLHIALRLDVCGLCERQRMVEYVPFVSSVPIAKYHRSEFFSLALESNLLWISFHNVSLYFSLVEKRPIHSLRMVEVNEKNILYDTLNSCAPR